MEYGRGIHKLVEKGNEWGNPHCECAPAQGSYAILYALLRR